MDLANRRCSEWRAAVGRIAAARKEGRKACFGRTDDNFGRHGSEACRSGAISNGKQSWRSAAIGWNRQADGKDLRIRTTRLTGPIAGFHCRGRSFAGTEGLRALTDRPERQA